MDSTEPQMRSITGKLTPNKLTERNDDFTCNVVYQANRNIKDLCQLAAVNSKFSASEQESAYNDLKQQAKIKLYNASTASTVEFGFAINSLAVDGPFIGPDAKFELTKNKVSLRYKPLAELKKDLENITVIISGTSEGLPVITIMTDVTTGSENNLITPGGGLNGKGNRVNIAGGVVLAIDVLYKFIIFIYMLVLLCVVFICLYQATRLYKSQTTHDSPRNVVYESDILSDNVYKSLLFSKIEAVQQKIDIVLHSNKTRLRYYKSAMNVIYAGVILFFAVVSVMLAIT